MTNLMITGQRYIHEYENPKGRLCDCNANIYLNRTCLMKRLTPNYAGIKIQSCVWLYFIYIS